jgi:hypothetical protein
VRLAAVAALFAALAVAGCGKESGGTATGTATATSTSTSTATATTTPVPETVIAQHILCAYKSAKRAPSGVTRTKAEARARATEALGKIRGGTSFEDIVKGYSDDAGSLDRMGSVGKFRREAMDPAFSAAAFALKVGEVSDIVETPFGFHLIKRTQ